MVLYTGIAEQLQGLNSFVAWVVSAHEDGSPAHHVRQKLAVVRTGTHDAVLETFHQLAIVWTANPRNAEYAVT